ncbi:hypothetical protein RQP46_004956 [Phenoliferia psychrophenolica]
MTAYADLGAALAKTSVAISDFNRVLAATADPKDQAALMAGANMHLPYFAAVGQAPAEENGKKGKKEKKEKKIKDPLAPKRPPSAYLEFQNSVRTKYRDAEPEVSYPDILRKISAVWGQMSEEDKKQYQDITNSKVASFEQAKHAYELQNGLPLSAPKDGDAVMTDISVDPKALGKDGKEYTGKKRGRKSNADKLREAEEAGLPPPDLQAIAKAAADAPKKEKKEKKAAAAAAPASAPKAKAPKSPTKSAAPAPASESESESVSGDSDSSDDDSDEEEEEEEEEDTEPVASTSKDKRKVAAEPVASKSKKSKVA